MRLFYWPGIWWPTNESFKLADVYWLEAREHARRHGHAVVRLLLDAATGSNLLVMDGEMDKVFVTNTRYDWMAEVLGEQMSAEDLIDEMRRNPGFEHVQD